MKKRKPLLYVYHPRELNGEHAFLIADFLESVLNMLWREFGDDMADFQGRVFPDSPPSIFEPLYCKKCLSDNDDLEP